MNAAARRYTDQTLKKLFALSGNECAFLGCCEQMVNRRNAKNSNICHIEGASPGGERYNPDMEDVERADYPNLILLCVQHHDETNDVEKYTVDVLKKMKAEHEDSILGLQLKKAPSMLANAIAAIADIQLINDSKSKRPSVFNIDKKITHNGLRENAQLIHTYKVYHQKINTLYDELEQAGSLRKERLLDNINSIYIRVLGEFIHNSSNIIESIREQSDAIFDTVFDRLCEKMEDSQHWEEDIMLAVRLIMVDAFMRCKILEEPPTQNDPE